MNFVPTTCHAEVSIISLPYAVSAAHIRWAPVFYALQGTSTNNNCDILCKSKLCIPCQSFATLFISPDREPNIWQWNWLPHIDLLLTTIILSATFQSYVPTKTNIQQMNNKNKMLHIIILIGTDRRQLTQMSPNETNQHDDRLRTIIKTHTQHIPPKYNQPRKRRIWKRKFCQTHLKYFIHKAVIISKSLFSSHYNSGNELWWQLSIWPMIFSNVFIY